MNCKPSSKGSVQHLEPPVSTSSAILLLLRLESLPAGHDLLQQTHAAKQIRDGVLGQLQVPAFIHCLHQKQETCHMLNAYACAGVVHISI